EPDANIHIHRYGRETPCCSTHRGWTTEREKCDAASGRPENERENSLVSGLNLVAVEALEDGYLEGGGEPDRAGQVDAQPRREEGGRPAGVAGVGVVARRRASRVQDGPALQGGLEEKPHVEFGEEEHLRVGRRILTEAIGEGDAGVDAI